MQVYFKLRKSKAVLYCLFHHTEEIIIRLGPTNSNLGGMGSSVRCMGRRKRPSIRKKHAHSKRKPEDPGLGLHAL